MPAKARAVRDRWIGRGGGRGAPARLGRLAVLVAILLCFCWQTCLTQAHVHLGPQPAAAAAVLGSEAPVQLSRAPGRSETPLPCVLCRELLHAGHFMPGVPPLLGLLLAGIVLGPTPSEPLADVRPARSHSWYGRGPPASTALS